METFRKTRKQSGQIYRRHGAWYIRFYAYEWQDGVAVRVRRNKWLAHISDQYRSEKDLKELIDPILATVNHGAQPEGSLKLSDFYEFHFLPHIEQKIAQGHKKHSSLRFYRDTWKARIKKAVGHIRLNEFKPSDAQKLLESDDLSHLTHASLMRIKTCLSAAFNVARQKDFISTPNPIAGIKAEGQESTFEGHATTLDELVEYLTELDEPSRTVVAVAGFAGLREGELRGLEWPHYDGYMLDISQAVWRTHVGKTKTPKSKAKVPVIAPLKKILDQHKKRTGGAGFIFAGPSGKSLNLDNLARREIKPIMGERWHGWHAFRRGLSTTLFELGVESEIAALIMRHSVEIQRKHYQKLKAAKHGKAAMEKLEKLITRRGIGQQLGNKQKAKNLAKNA